MQYSWAFVELVKYFAKDLTKNIWIYEVFFHNFAKVFRV